MFINKSALILALGLSGLATLGMRAEQSAGEQAPVPVVAPSPAPKEVKPSMGMNPQMMPSGGPQSALTAEEREILNKARAELQKDPELAEITNQIKALVEKRGKLAEEKFKAISPEAAAIVQRMKEKQEKMQAERRAQMDAMQAKKAAESAETAPAPAKSDKPAAPTVPAANP